MTERLTLMAVHAHPDDECMGTGGVLARYGREGIRTVLVTATRGEEGEMVDPDMNPDEVKPKLGDVRTAELERACKHLQVEELYILGYRESGMVGWATNNQPDCLAQADLHEATGRLVRLMRALRPHVITCYDEQGGYGHPDHIQVHRMTVAGGSPRCWRGHAVSRAGTRPLAACQTLLHCLSTLLYSHTLRDHVRHGSQSPVRSP
jgi:N-acetyl-1-D-myo-inositol-2-amino-2-deoxy-alpha-D-glucopyranoside deacetylase